MVSHNPEAYDTLGSLIRSCGGLITSLRGMPELRFELPAENAEAITKHLTLLGYVPQFVSQELRLGGPAPTVSVSIYCLKLAQ